MDRHNAYTAMLMRHREMLWRMCWNWTGGNRDRCCDLLQEVSIALWENFDKLRPGASASQESSWVRWQARSVFYQIGRQKRLSTVPLSDALSDRVADDESQQRKELLDDLMAALDPDEQRMVRLYLDGYRGDEIGKEIGISRDNFYQRMHRTIQKMRRLALVLLALLLSSAVAIAVVPQWRQFFFGGGGGEEPLEDTVPLQSDSVPATNPSSTPVRSAAKARRDTSHVEHLSPLNPFDSTSVPEKLTPAAEYDGLSISVNGNRLFITGAIGEKVRVYDNSGSLVAAQTAGSLCIIDLFPSTDIIPGQWRYHYHLQIGNRPTLLLKL